MRMRVERNGEPGGQPEERTEGPIGRITPEFRKLHSRSTSRIEVGPLQVRRGHRNRSVTRRSVRIAAGVPAPSEKERQREAEHRLSHTASFDVVSNAEHVCGSERVTGSYL